MEADGSESRQCCCFDGELSSRKFLSPSDEMEGNERGICIVVVVVVVIVVIAVIIDVIVGVVVESRRRRRRRRRR